MINNIPEVIKKAKQETIEDILKESLIHTNNKIYKFYSKIDYIKNLDRFLVGHNVFKSYMISKIKKTQEDYISYRNFLISQ